MHKVTLVKHPQANGQAKAANKVILGRAKGLWVEHLLGILWAYHYSPQSTTVETLYRFTYRTDAMILVEIDKLSHRRSSFNSFENLSTLRVDLNLVKEVREQACATRRYNSKVRPRDLNDNDLEDRKLTPSWEGPFQILESLGNDAYHLE
ncbi:hypothetical protein CR513_06562, partial [Mucuna pruriens]